MSPQKINILEKPTFDLIEWEIVDSIYNDNIIFCQTKQIFKFDKCKGMIMPRSRVLRRDKIESIIVKNIISATIDAGFTGRLDFKIELMEKGKLIHNYFRENKKNMIKAFQNEIKDSVQIDLVPFSNNYYNGTNQTDLKPDVIFHV